MQIKTKIKSYFLLVLYLLVVLTQLVQHTHSSDILESASHKHESFEDNHHAHQFHIGIFHFFGHLFGTFVHQDDLEQNSPVTAQNSQEVTVKKITEVALTNSFCYFFNEKVVIAIDAESLTDPPYHHHYLQSLLQISTPLRAPPTLV